MAERAAILGPAAYGVVIRDAKGEVIAELSDYLGIQTNNYAEYSGLLAALGVCRAGKTFVVKSAERL